MRVDAHHHVWDLARRPQAWLDEPGMESLRRDFTLADLAPRTKTAGIDRTVLVQVLADADETRECLTEAAACDLVAGVVGWADLTAMGELPCADGPLVGIRHLVQDESDPHWLNRPDVRRGLREVAEAGLVYDLLVRPHQLPAAIETVRAIPELTFVLDHAAKPPIASGELEPWAAQIRRLAAEPNVFCKLSGLVTEAPEPWTVADLHPYAATVLDAFGPSRLMYGSDWPVCLLAATYELVLAAAEDLMAGLTAAEYDDVFGGTAVRVYGLAT
jgi:L-fuconolactonase